MSRYTVIIYTPQELNHASNIQTGLFELEQQGLISVKVKLSLAKHKGRIVVNEEGSTHVTKQAHPKASFYKLIDKKSKKEILFATDLYDHAEQFSEFGLKHCDYYFKRSYESRIVKTLPIEQQNKLHKLGMTFGTHSKHKKKQGLFRLGLLLSNLSINLKWDRFLLKRLRTTYRLQTQHWKFINTTRLVSRFESINKASRNTILFQTRCFLHENDADVKAIHLQRYAIIKLLRKHFPDKFLGGFIPSKVVNEKYSDAISNVPSNPEKYLDAVKKSKIVIYTRGLANSPAWKMAEYLSQGKVIIAEQPTTEFPMPLTHGKEVLFFNTDQELIQNIKRVLDDNDLAESLSNSARAYFEKHVHPKENVKRILELMLNKTLS